MRILKIPNILVAGDLRPFRRPAAGPAVSAAGKCSGTKSEVDQIFPWLIGESSQQCPAKNRRDDVQNGDQTEEKWPFKETGCILESLIIYGSLFLNHWVPKNLDLDFSLDFLNWFQSWVHCIRTGSSHRLMDQLPPQRCELCFQLLRSDWRQVNASNIK